MARSASWQGSGGAYYFDAERGRFDAFLIREARTPFEDDEVIAYTDGDCVIGTPKNISDHAEIEDWADEFGYEIEWR